MTGTGTSKGLELDAPVLPEPIYLTMEPIVVNLSPDAFHLWAGDFLQAARNFVLPERFSGVPYFLLCRAIELEIKSRLLVHAKQGKVKDKYGHNLVKAYNALPSQQQILDPDDLSILGSANELYEVKKKRFEYWSPLSAFGGDYRNAPNLGLLHGIASRLIDGTETPPGKVVLMEGLL